MTQQLAHKTALVTGGTDGIGRTIAQSLAARGIQVAVVGRDAAKGTGRCNMPTRWPTRKPAPLSFENADPHLASRGNKK